MSVKIRLARHGAKKAPFYRVVVADERARRDGRFIEVVGRYNPRTEPMFLELDLESIDKWLGEGAQPTEAASKLIQIARGDKSAPDAVKKPSKKQIAREEAEKAAAEEAKKAEAEAAAAAKEAEAAAAEAAKAEAEAAEAPEETAEETKEEGAE